MKLTTNTLEILKNFANINPNLQFKSGNYLITKSESNNIRAIATLDQEFPKDFCVMDLPQLISVVNLYKEPDLQFNDKHVIIGEDKRNVKYQYTPPQMITDVGYDKMLSFKLPFKELISFNLSGEQISKLLKSASVLGLTSIGINSANDELIISAYDPKYPSANRVEFELGNCDVNFKATYSVDVFKMIQSDYKVTVYESSLTKLENDRVTYYIASEVVQ